jgi:hypothetical protein
MPHSCRNKHGNRTSSADRRTDAPKAWRLKVLPTPRFQDGRAAGGNRAALRG